MASHNQRKSRKQFRTPIVGLGTVEIPLVGPRRFARAWRLETVALPGSRFQRFTRFTRIFVGPLIVAPAVRPTIFVRLTYERTLYVRIAFQSPSVTPETTVRFVRAQDLILRHSLAPERDVTGWTVEWRVRNRVIGNDGGLTTVLTKTTASGITVASAGKGIFDVGLSLADTQSLTPSRELSDDYGYTWEMRRIDSGYNVVLGRGDLILLRDVFGGVD